MLEIDKSGNFIVKDSILEKELFPNISSVLFYARSSIVNDEIKIDNIQYMNIVMKDGMSYDKFIPINCEQGKINIELNVIKNQITNYVLNSDKFVRDTTIKRFSIMFLNKDDYEITMISDYVFSFYDQYCISISNKHIPLNKREKTRYYYFSVNEDNTLLKWKELKPLVDNFKLSNCISCNINHIELESWLLEKQLKEGYISEEEYENRITLLKFKNI